MSDGREMADETETEEYEYVHILDSEGRCSCGEFAMDPNDAYFVQHAAKHFRETREVVRREGFTTGLIWGVTLMLLLIAALFLLLGLGVL